MTVCRVAFVADGRHSAKLGHAMWQMFTECSCPGTRQTTSLPSARVLHSAKAETLGKFGFSGSVVMSRSEPWPLSCSTYEHRAQVELPHNIPFLLHASTQPFAMAKHGAAATLLVASLLVVAAALAAGADARRPFNARLAVNRGASRGDDKFITK